MIPRIWSRNILCSSYDFLKFVVLVTSKGNRHLKPHHLFTPAEILNFPIPYKELSMIFPFPSVGQILLELYRRGYYQPSPCSMGIHGSTEHTQGSNEEEQTLFWRPAISFLHPPAVGHSWDIFHLPHLQVLVSMVLLIDSSLLEHWTGTGCGWYHY
jgi:hypothetical protein